MGKKLGRKLDRLLTLVIAVVLLPLFITIVLQRMKLEDVIYGEQESVMDTESGPGADALWRPGTMGQDPDAQAGGAAGTGEGAQASDGAGAGEGAQASDGAGAGEDAQASDGAGTGADVHTAGATGAGEGAQPGGTAGTGEGGQSGAEFVMQEDAEQQVAAILAKEIRFDANEEAILAQSVIVRTNLYDAWERQAEAPEGLSVEEMQMIWGDAYVEILRELERCASRTKGEVLTWEGDYIYAPYHAMSAGMTRDIAAIYPGTELPYLRAVSCVEDATAEGSLSVTVEDTEDFIEKCRDCFQEAEINGIEELEALSRDDAGYVIEMRVGNITCTGEEFRSRLGLNSACYTITEQGGQVRVVTKGLGHGLGLSQHAAECMAEDGQDYREILAYFYPGAQIDRAEPAQ